LTISFFPYQALRKQRRGQEKGSIQKVDPINELENLVSEVVPPEF
jgi:hypothetical protein